jgi:hypothetical protein
VHYKSILDYKNIHPVDKTILIGREGRVKHQAIQEVFINNKYMLSWVDVMR